MPFTSISHLINCQEGQHNKLVLPKIQYLYSVAKAGFVWGFILWARGLGVICGGMGGWGAYGGRGGREEK